VIPEFRSEFSDSGPQLLAPPVPPRASPLSPTTPTSSSFPPEPFPARMPSPWAADLLRPRTRPFPRPTPCPRPRRPSCLPGSPSPSPAADSDRPICLRCPLRAPEPAADRLRVPPLLPAWLLVSNMDRLLAPPLLRLPRRKFFFLCFAPYFDSVIGSRLLRSLPRLPTSSPRTPESLPRLPRSPLPSVLPL
jgi:hypothetical protein